jgi:hypothetical protein
MSIVLILILIICSLQLLGVMLLNMIYHQHLSSMHGMVISMTLGMLAGLLFGAVIGLSTNENLLVFSFLVGLVVGYLAGLPFGIAAVVDGSVSGLMGGMMGAMLGDMFPMFSPDTLIKLLTFFTMMIVLLIHYATEDSLKSSTNHKLFLIVTKHPYLYATAIVVLFFFLKDVELIIGHDTHHHDF